MPYDSFLQDPEYRKSIGVQIALYLQMHGVAPASLDKLVEFAQRQFDVHRSRLLKQELAKSFKDRRSVENARQSLEALLDEAVRLNRARRRGVVRKGPAEAPLELELVDLEQAHKEKFCRIFPLCSSTSDADAEEEDDGLRPMGGVS